MSEIKKLNQQIKELQDKLEWMEFDMEYMIFNEDYTGDYITKLVHKLYGNHYKWDYVCISDADDKFEEVFNLDLPNDHSEIGIYQEKGGK